MDADYIAYIRDGYQILKKRMLTQDAYKNLSPEAQKLLAYIIIAMRNMRSRKLSEGYETYPKDMAFYEFDLSEYYEVTKTKTTSDSIIMQALEELCQTRYWIPLEDGGWQCVSWLKDALISADGHVKVELHKFVGLGLTGVFDLIDDWGMKLKYSKPLYRFLCSSQDTQIIVTVDQVRNALEATDPSYGRYSNFKQRVLDAAVREINDCTDICVQFDKKKNFTKDGKEILLFTVLQKLSYLKPRHTVQTNIQKRLPLKNLLPQEEASPVQKVHTARKAQSIQETKTQLPPLRQTANIHPSAPGESEEEDLPF